ncbi:MULTISPECIES: DUF3040 domain-containing protein [Thermomonospora]|uniref:Ferric-dicitrate binding protein FerR (Iron transport regulator) n=1 Tax=Thermomonospora cellulosilytica TaxID=1411118 RepID=A0A7W3N1D3_9ACTN|nr:MULTISPECIES: DUF3040 domain-containing protein [Thermomonospora]MBA9005677.1 ferric-dicitrate binding protein FerR (iron transport regulator) [Thermomonospora cellulosilytica]
MALSMEEQRILAQIETHLAHDDPRLAARLSALPRLRRRRRMRAVAAAVLVPALLAVLLVVVT